MEIGHCKDCIHWKHTGHKTGNCDKIYAYVGEVGNTDCRRWSLNSFGCVLFEKYPTGPFSVIKSCGFEIWNIFIAMPHEKIRVLKGNKKRMGEIAAILNEQWEIWKRRE